MVCEGVNKGDRGDGGGGVEGVYSFLNKGATLPWARVCGRSPTVPSSSSEIYILKMVTLGGARQAVW